MHIQKPPALCAQKKVPVMGADIGMGQNQVVIDSIEQTREALYGRFVFGAFQVNRKKYARIHLPADIVEQQRLQIARHRIVVTVEIALE